jgi:hypothetical protein
MIPVARSPWASKTSNSSVLRLAYLVRRLLAVGLIVTEGHGAGGSNGGEHQGTK